MDSYGCWMVRQNLKYVEVEGLEVVLARLRRQGYYDIADAVERLGNNS